MAGAQARVIPHFTAPPSKARSPDRHRNFAKSVFSGLHEVLPFSSGEEVGRGMRRTNPMAPPNFSAALFAHSRRGKKGASASLCKIPRNRYTPAFLKKRRAWDVFRSGLQNPVTFFVRALRELLVFSHDRMVSSA